jgi:hypothetical protein
MRYYTLIDTRQPKFDQPKRSSTYPDGKSIPESLPNSYGLAQHCGNCAAYDLKTTICATYNAVVRTTYWCATWKAK